MDINGGIVNKGNQVGIQLLVRNKQNITIGCLGGSITNGSGVDNPEDSYGDL